MTAFCSCPTCCYATCCVPCVFARARSDFDSSNCCFNLVCVPPVVNVSIIREGYGISGGCCSDLIFGTCLAPCGAAMLREHMASEKKKQAAPGTPKK